MNEKNKIPRDLRWLKKHSLLQTFIIIGFIQLALLLHLWFPRPFLDIQFQDQNYKYKLQSKTNSKI
jgi:hypothetical protein